MDKRPLFITGIGTGIGKTVVSAVVTEKLKADYWKPVQSGDLESSDTMKVKSLVSNKATVFHPEAYRLTQPYSPHKSAALDGITIDPKKIILPKTKNTLIIEGAGGLMVPLNERYMMVDLVKQLNAEVILVSQFYLGSINHTLLSLLALKQYQVPVKGIIFNGDMDDYTRDIILSYSKARLLGCLPLLNKIDKRAIIKLGENLAL